MLKPCPFCGSADITKGVLYQHGSAVPGSAVRCAQCGARATEEAWQKRSSAEPPKTLDPHQMLLDAARFIEADKPLWAKAARDAVAAARSSAESVGCGTPGCTDPNCDYGKGPLRCQTCGAVARNEPQTSAESELASAVMGLEYYINNPSAWDHFDDEMSERLRPIVELAKRVRNEPQTASDTLSNAARCSAKSVACPECGWNGGGVRDEGCMIAPCPRMPAAARCSAESERKPACTRSGCPMFVGGSCPACGMNVPKGYGDQADDVPQAAPWPKEIWSFVNEVAGVWDAFEHGLRQEISNTNYACVREKLTAVETILAAPRCQAGNVENAAVADQIIGQIEDRFPNWRSYRDLIDCIDSTLHQLRSDAAALTRPQRSVLGPLDFLRPKEPTNEG